MPSITGLLKQGKAIGSAVGKKAYQKLHACQSEQTILIAGCQRSGTNMLMEMLDLSLQTDVFHERDERAFANYQMRDISVIQALKENSQAPTFVIKTLCELETIPHLQEQLAPVKVIWIYRDYRDVVNSMLKSFRNQAKQIKRLSSGVDDSWWGKGLSPKNLLLLQTVVTDNISDTDAAALQWYVRNSLLFELNLANQTDVLVVNYEQLVTQPQSVLAKVFAFCNLSYDQKFGSNIFANSIGKQGVPAFSPDIADLNNSLFEQLKQLG
ncbi:sulfotransferase family protein [Motilimonas pumila]|uniref:Sulfotransferase family protein n=1 Tax=Motilimonas pumila TaxID=2303987 RepID=A0A418YH83_9GAMM|nr:sulfotransferase [Motilimonas pumila]RJG49456.1 sulfotransferase family protein [Motilimonas pumila]